MYLYMSWKDHRLRHRFTEPVLVNDNEIRKKLWSVISDDFSLLTKKFFQFFRLPDLYFANAKEAKVHEVTAPNFNMFIERDGTIAYSCRFTFIFRSDSEEIRFSRMSISCNLQLRNYPMDVQMCGIRILSC